MITVSHPGTCNGGSSGIVSWGCGGRNCRYKRGTKVAGQQRQIYIMMRRDFCGIAHDLKNPARHSRGSDGLGYWDLRYVLPSGPL